MNSFRRQGISLILLCVPAIGFCQESELPVSQNDQTFTLPNNSAPENVFPAALQSSSGSTIGERLRAEVAIFRDNHILDELELVEDQRKTLFKTLDSLTRSFDEQQSEALNKGLTAEGLSSMMSNFERKFDDTIRANLLPNQMDRLVEIRLQQEVKNLIIPNHPKTLLWDLLKLSPAQLKQIANGRTNLHDEIKREIDELIFQRQKAFLESVLNPDQKTALEKALGKPVRHHRTNSK